MDDNDEQVESPAEGDVEVRGKELEDTELGEPTETEGEEGGEKGKPLRQIGRVGRVGGGRGPRSKKFLTGGVSRGGESAARTAGKTGKVFATGGGHTFRTATRTGVKAGLRAGATGARVGGEAALAASGAATAGTTTALAAATEGAIQAGKVATKLAKAAGHIEDIGELREEAEKAAKKWGKIAIYVACAVFVIVFFLPIIVISSLFIGEQPAQASPTTPLEGIIFPLDLKPCIPVDSYFPERNGGVPGEYCQLPYTLSISPRRQFYSEGSLTNIYEKRMQSNKWQDWGAKEMIGVLYTVAKRWKEKYPQGHLIIMDITSDYHIEHKWGVAVDITATTNRKDCVANNRKNWRCPYGPYNLEATIDLGKIIIDTGYFDTIWYSDTQANAPIYSYATSIDPKRYPPVNRGGNTSGNTGIRPVPEPHWDHFHLDIDRTKARTSYHTWNFLRSKLENCVVLTGILRKICFP